VTFRLIGVPLILAPSDGAPFSKKMGIEQVLLLLKETEK